MTSRLQQPRHADEQSARRFVGFPFRLQPDPQPGGQLSVIERQTIAASLDALISAAVEMRAMVRGA